MFLQQKMASKPSNNRIQVVEPQIDAVGAIKQIINDGQEDAFYICDISDVIQKYKNWKKALPRVQSFYAVKCNDSRIILETLIALECGFDCASKEEIEKILSMGVNPERIIFANPVKRPSHIRYAAEVGVSVMTFDSETELYKIKREFPEANLVLRIRYDDPTAIYVLGLKFGADIKTEAEDLLLLARSLNFNVIGVSFHIGSGSKNFKIYGAAIAAAKKIFDLGTRLGYNFHLLDIGGGFPGEKNCRIDEIGQCINQALNTNFDDLSVQIIAEPGRYYADSAFTLATNISAVKTAVKIDDDDGSRTELKMYYVDTGIYGSLLCAAFGDFYTPQPLYDDLKNPVYPSIVWGATCDSCDKICDNIDLPLMGDGDWMIFEKAGAYTLTLSCEFNGIPAPNVHSIISTEDWLYLTEKVSSPLPKSRFVKGNSLNHFRTGLDIVSSPNKYFV